MTARTSERPLRADAARNRLRVVEAAEQVFAELGLEASVDDVAARAGVGRATIYRSFPTKDHLVAGVAIERLRRFEQMALEALAEEDAGTAFRGFLVRIAEAHPKDRVMLEAMRLGEAVPELAEARAATSAAIGRLIDGGRRQGALRKDATADDVRVLFSGLTHALTPEQQRDGALLRRYANLIADALSA
ncbi:MAG: TetR/AcrR family transcriptional regulator [Solirubrobacteraceae bacterium]